MFQQSPGLHPEGWELERWGWDDSLEGSRRSQKQIQDRLETHQEGKTCLVMGRRGGKGEGLGRVGTGWAVCMT